ncbi:hypothetical protein LEAN103870_14790 [Legionella anisa]|uniref:YCII-related domain-containing protein n=1 Tax=Legionella anisa TaxID=28082 RepID=A0AAX0WZ23_9GAMM|nr:hypothetical protein [Legionella anisa]AWN73492.1 hypothetical protein DLD14_06345 [Legionella anisa]KTC70796.1 hypothetical protein Lani_2343 [Legionella anisa]MBN5935365.1 hypothetical protein [Legionella anisa]MCW8426366.1 hypothetical protein [Legionella anisa]MCW8448026.1 hypothetical protein [Legionella anisa]
MKYIVIKANPTDTYFKRHDTHVMGEKVLLEIDKRLKAHYNDRRLLGVRGLSADGKALDYSNSSGVCYWMFEGVSKDAIDAIIQEGDHITFAELNFTEQKSNQFWKKDFSIEIKNINFTQANNHEPLVSSFVC